jgi:hypothetical protein
MWRDGEIVIGRFHDGAVVSGDDARENLGVLLELIGEERAPVLVDLRPVQSQSAEARSVFAGPDAFRVSHAVALLIGSPVSRVIGNFYLGFNKPMTPSRLFTDPAEARIWLLALHEQARRRDLVRVR